MLKFSVQTFYQPLLSHSFPFSNFPLAILFPSVILFPSKSFPHQKAKGKNQKAESRKPSFSAPFINSSKLVELRFLGRGMAL
jgi:hypothetical protein